MDINQTESNPEAALLAERQRIAKEQLARVRRIVNEAQAAITPVPGDEIIGAALSILGQCDTILELGSR